MEDDAYRLTEKGRGLYETIVNMYNDNLEIDEIANYLGLTELEVKIMVILGDYDG